MRSIISTVNSRFDALDVGIKLVAERLDRLFAVKERIVGGLTLAAFLGVAGMAAAVYTVMRLVNITSAAATAPAVPQPKTP